MREIPVPENIFNEAGKRPARGAGAPDGKPPKVCEDFTFEIFKDGKSVEVTGYAGARKEICIPARIKNLPVSVIGEWAFSESGLTAVTIPDGVIAIADRAFGDNLLASVDIPASVTYIGEWAFLRNRLVRVNIPGSVASIGDEAFAFNQIASLEIPASVTFIGAFAFAENPLASVTIPADVSIERGAFLDTQLTRVKIGANVRLKGWACVFDRELDDFLCSNRTGNRIKAGTYSYSANRWSYLPEKKNIG
jgi:hypothetical protein